MNTGAIEKTPDDECSLIGSVIRSASAPGDTRRGVC